MPKWPIPPAGLCAFLAFAPGPAAACACCSNDGQRYEGTVSIDASDAGLLAELRFAETAHLYVGEGDLEAVDDVTTTSTELRLSVEKRAEAWVFTFVDPSGPGSVTLPVPKTVTKLMIDPRDATADATRHEPVLYKEWRLAGPLRATGLFARLGGHGRTATLIIHGRGNSCTDASQFNAWTLMMSGRQGGTGGGAMLFGDLVP